MNDEIVHEDAHYRLWCKPGQYGSKDRLVLIEPKDGDNRITVGYEELGRIAHVLGENEDALQLFPGARNYQGRKKVVQFLADAIELGVDQALLNKHGIGRSTYWKRRGE